jgi:hypothetical protein
MKPKGAVRLVERPHPIEQRTDTERGCDAGLLNDPVDHRLTVRIE